MNDKKPFNDVTDHYTKHVGVPSKVELQKLPKVLRIFGYTMFVFWGVSTIIIVIGLIGQWLR